MLDNHYIVSYDQSKAINNSQFNKVYPSLTPLSLSTPVFVYGAKNTQDADMLRVKYVKQNPIFDVILSILLK